VIDYKNKKSNKYFTGAEYSFVNNKSFNSEFLEITEVIKKLSWDTEFWGFPVAYLSCRYLTASIVYRIDKFIKSENIKLIEYLCNCHDNKSVRTTAANNFIFADIRLSFEKKRLEKQNVTLPAEFKFGLAQPQDIEVLAAIAKDLYLDSRYYYDENFDKAKACLFYQNWVEKAVLGTFDDQCYCLFKKEGNVPIGFCTIKYKLPGTANIGLVGLSDPYQKKGLAQILLQLVTNELIDKSIKQICVVTQGRNYAAQRLYQRAGFLTKATEIWYHKWL
jgi:dTDP-4-amino-4,6-dideoxy-D-galactose acyltransferase